MIRSRFFHIISLGLILMFLASMLRLATPRPVQAAVPSGYAEFFIFGTENQLFTIF
jgi:hypothetical protein